MARVSKTNPFHARRLAEARANNEGQEEREETQTESKDEDDETSSESSDEDWLVEEKKRKGKSPIEKPGKRGKRGPMKGVVIGLPKIQQIDILPKRRSARKTTFAARLAAYEQEEMATNSDPKGKGKQKMEETDEYEEDEACKGNWNGKYMDDGRDKDDDVMPGLMDI